MTVVSRTVSTSHPAAIPVLKALASLVGLNEGSSISFDNEPRGSDSFLVEMNVTAQNSFSGTSTSYTVSGLLGCAKAICNAVPECGLWGQEFMVTGSGSGLESQIEAWIEKAVDALVTPSYISSDSKGEGGEFISVWYNVVDQTKFYPTIVFTFMMIFINLFNILFSPDCINIIAFYHSSTTFIADFLFETKMLNK